MEVLKEEKNMFSPPSNNNFGYIPFHSFVVYSFTDCDLLIHANLYRLIFKIATILIINVIYAH